MGGVVVCTDLSGKEPHKQVGVGRVVTSGSLGDSLIISTDFTGKQPHTQGGMCRVCCLLRFYVLATFYRHIRKRIDMTQGELTVTL